MDAVRNWRLGGGLVVVSNTTYQAAPWADAVFAMDPKWWSVHYERVRSEFQGRRLTTARMSGMDVEKINVPHYRNSGAGCISFAIKEGAREIILLGYDCMPDGTLTHWHGSHPQPLSDAKTMNIWPLIFNRLAKDVRREGIQVFNASRRTALACFKRVELAEVLLS